MYEKWKDCTKFYQCPSLRLIVSTWHTFRDNFWDFEKIETSYVKIWEIYVKFLKCLYFYIVHFYELGQFFYVNFIYFCTKKIVPAHEIQMGRSINILEICLFFSEN